MRIKFECELNRAWVINKETDETIGETNFVVSHEWVEELFNKMYANKYDNLEEFLDAYEPEVDGEFIYQKAIKDGVLLEDLGIVMY